MSRIIIELDDKKSDEFLIAGLETGSDIDAAELDGGHLVFMRPDRSIAINSAIKYGTTKTKNKKEKK